MHLFWVCTVYLSLFLSHSEVSILSGSALFEYREQLLVSSVDNLCDQFGPRSGTDETSVKIWIQTVSHRWLIIPNFLMIKRISRQNIMHNFAVRKVN